MQILHQRGTVVVGFGLVQPEIGLDAGIGVVEGAVLDDGNLLAAGDLEERTDAGTVPQTRGRFFCPATSLQFVR